MTKPNASNVGKKNLYACTMCKHFIITIDVDNGVTPFMIRCKRKGCKGTMQSAFYKPLPALLQMKEPDFEWYRKTQKELVDVSEDAREHASKGGLFLRERKQNVIDRHRAQR